MKKLNKKVKNRKDNKIITLIFILVMLCLMGIYIIIRVSNRQYSKDNKYTCNEGYSLVNKKCVKEKESIKVSINYSCDSGYELKGSSCVKYNVKDATAKWGCPSGYIMATDKYPDVCYKKETVPTSIQYYYCPGEYTLMGTQCIKNTAITNATKEYYCSNNSIYNSTTGLCHLIGVFSQCPSGTWLNGGAGDYKTCVTNPTIQYTCPSGTNKEGTQCIGQTLPIDADYIKGCNKGYEINQETQMCTKIDYETPSYKLSCESGYILNNESCIKTISIKAKEKKYCPNNYTMKLDNCIIYDEQEPIRISE